MNRQSRVPAPLALTLLVVFVSGCGSGQSSAYDYEHCPKRNPNEAISVEMSAGNRGQTVPLEPSKALICRWLEVDGHAELAERVIRSETDLRSIVSALNSLGPYEEIEGVHSCETGPPHAYFIVLTYDRSGEVVPVEAEYATCAQVDNVAAGTSFQTTDGLKKTLDSVLPGVKRG